MMSDGARNDDSSERGEDCDAEEYARKEKEEKEER